MATLPSTETLPVFAGNEVIWEQARYAHSASNNFVRIACSSTDPSVFQTPLQEVLDSTDYALEVFARQCGAFVLPHVWGLVEVPDGQEWRLGDELGSRTQHPEVPDGMLLAAKVERIISPHRLPRREHKAIESLSVRYYETMRHAAGAYLTDMQARQLSLGRLSSRGSRRIRILHDIEPRIAINR